MRKLLIVLLIALLFCIALSQEKTENNQDKADLDENVEASVDDLIDEEEVDEDDTAVLFGDVFGTNEGSTFDDDKEIKEATTPSKN